MKNKVTKATTPKLTKRAVEVLSRLEQQTGKSASELVCLLDSIYPGDEALGMLDEARALSGDPERLIVEQGIIYRSKFLITSARKRAEDTKRKYGSGTHGAADGRISKAYDQLVEGGRDVTRGALRSLANTGAATVDNWLKRNHPEILDQ